MLATIADFVQFLSSEALHGGNRIPANALMALRMHLLQSLVIAAHHRRLDPGLHFLFRHRSGQAHHFRSASNDAVFHAAHHLRSSQVHRSDPAPAKTVQSGAAGGDVIARIERGHAAHVARLHPVLRGD